MIVEIVKNGILGFWSWTLVEAETSDECWQYDNLIFVKDCWNLNFWLRNLNYSKMSDTWFLMLNWAMLLSYSLCELPSCCCTATGIASHVSCTVFPLVYTEQFGNGPQSCSRTVTRQCCGADPFLTRLQAFEIPTAQNLRSNFIRLLPLSRAVKKSKLV